jgi:hypothetical protein
MVSALADWVRRPGDDDEIDIRRTTLRARVEAQRLRPRVDSYGQISFRDRFASLSPLDARPATALVCGSSNGSRRPAIG